MSLAVYLTFGTLPEGWCPSGAQDLVDNLNGIVTGVTADGDVVRVQFGVFLPGECPETFEEFIEALNKIVTGYVMGTGDSVRIIFGAITGCWSDPQSIVDALAANYTAYVEGT